MQAQETHVYVANLNDYHLPTPAEIKKILPEEEYLKTQNFATELLKRNALISKILTRKILSQYTNLAPELVPIIRTEHEKPTLTAPFNDLNFSIAHTKTYFALAITQKALLGIDIETTQKNIDALAIAKRFFHPKEYQALTHSPKPEDLFFKIWVQKEAFVKAIGHGLSFGLEKFCVDPEAGKILTIDDPNYIADEFYSYLFTLPEQHYACISANKELKGRLHIVYLQHESF